MVTKLLWENIIDLLRNVQYRLVLVMPAVHEEWIDAINSKEQNARLIEYLICIDNSESVIRNGYGSEKSIDRLKLITSEIKECKDLRVNFIAADDKAYCLFLESRILEGNPRGYNAVELDKEVAERIIRQFFPNPNVSQPDSLVAEPLNEQVFEKVKNSLKNTPPALPDLQRQINTYRTHFQYAEIHFEGGNIQSKTITIPKEALPFKDSDLKKRMKTRFNLFTKEDTEKWTNLDEINKMIAKIRADFLHPCKYKKGRSIIKKENKELFLNKIEDLKTLVADKTNQLREVVQIAINKSEDVLIGELTDFFTVNMPEKISGITDGLLRKRQLSKMVQEIISKTRIPDAGDLIDKMVIDTQYAEFTEEDLIDENFLNWFKEKELITPKAQKGIASFSKAYQTKI